MPRVQCMAEWNGLRFEHAGQILGWGLVGRHLGRDAVASWQCRQNEE